MTRAILTIVVIVEQSGVMKACLLTAALTVAGIAGCGQVAADDGNVHVVAAFYPLQYQSARIGGDMVAATDPTKPGADVVPHG
jgi:zinc transport system substrate-binding protein